MTNRLLKLLLGIVFLGSTISCLPENNDTTRDKMCPSDGANLYLKCSDGREKVFGIGYADEPIYVRKEGKWTSKAIDEFCADEPMLVDFYFKKTHLQVSGQQTGITAIFAWQSAQSQCMKLERDRLIENTTLKIETKPLSIPKPENERLR